MTFVCALRLKEALQEGSPSAGRCQDQLLQDPALRLALQAFYKHGLGGLEGEVGSRSSRVLGPEP